jgi:isochorismate synthase
MEDGWNYDIFDKLIDREQSFALFKRPYDNTVNLILQNNCSGPVPRSAMELTSDVSAGSAFEVVSEVVLEHISGSASQKEPFSLDKTGDYMGFVVCPFNISADTPLIVIKPDVFIKGENSIFDYLKEYYRCFSGKSSDEKERLSLMSKSNFEIYKNDFKIFHDALQSSDLEKIVLSRYADYKKEQSLSLGLVYKRAIEKYEDVFVYLCHTPQTGTWLGCSPELLMSGRCNEWRTVALAGTVRDDSSAERSPFGDEKSGEKPFEWDSKNTEEHKMVVDFIKKQLVSHGVEFSESKPYTVKAGRLRHLKSDFIFNLNSRKRAGELIKALYPTPAVCGSPKEKALKFILANENYDRRYYAGFVGPLNIDDSTDLFVNIRCMEVRDNILRLYAGGGLINSSSLENEWNETEYKMQTLLNII